MTNCTYTADKVHRVRPAPASTAAFLLFLAIALAGCGSAQPVSPASAMPAGDAVAGWSARDDVQSFDRDSLFDYANGGSEFFFLYGFEQMAVRHYAHQSGAIMTAEIWRLATTDDAYGLFSQSGTRTPIPLENAPNAALDSGSLMSFWQDRYYVLLRVTPPVPEGDLVAFAGAISSALPSGGAPPALLALLPADPEPEKPIVFFREEMVIQDSLYLGGANVLGLSQDTRGALAFYPIGEETVKVILVEYPDATSASAALEALQAGEVQSLLASRVKSNYLSAAFGSASQAEAETLLDAIAIP